MLTLTLTLGPQCFVSQVDSPNFPSFPLQTELKFNCQTRTSGVLDLK